MTQRSPMNLRVSRETKITVASYSGDYRFTSQLTNNVLDVYITSTCHSEWRN